MRYYKRLKWNNTNFKIGVIYTEDYMAEKLSKYHGWPNIDTEDWQEVPEIEYLLQVAKERYKEGDEIYTATGGSKTIRCDIRIDTQGYIIANHFWDFIILYEPVKKQWAEIVQPKTITYYEHETIMDKEMTHEEAIEELKHVPVATELQKLAIRKAIANMEQCEVYDKPVEMEVIDYEDGSTYEGNRLVHGKFKGKFIASDGLGETMRAWDNARPIKPKVLEFGDWIGELKEYFPHNRKEMNQFHKEYTQYLNDNK